jgi:hypothetical protein
MKDKNTEKDLIHPEKEGFAERVTPKKPEESIFFFKCEKENCGGIHFRHAGYVEIMLPFMRPGNEKRIGFDSLQVKVCVKCKAAYVWINEQMYDVTDQIDLKAWEKTETEMQKATGPGGEC